MDSKCYVLANTIANTIFHGYVTFKKSEDNFLFRLFFCLFFSNVQIISINEKVIKESIK